MTSISAAVILSYVAVAQLQLLILKQTNYFEVIQSLSSISDVLSKKLCN